jgi:hypothetical protein
MADRIEREIEEILKKLDVDEEAASKAPPRKGTGRPPIPISSRRKSSPGVSSRLGSAFSLPSVPAPPSSLIIAGAVLALAGFGLAGISGALIWISVTGIVLFMLGFLLSFLRRPETVRRTGGPTKRRWRNRDIEYNATDGPLTRLRRVFRRR